jgi:DNA-binding NarL/FixJ family response regulator
MSIELTSKEREILQLFAYGYTYKDIAKQLNKSPATVQTQTSQLRSKLSAETIAHAVAVGIRKNIIS